MKPPEPSGYVLDASAVLALFNAEPGADRVEAALEQEGTCISTVQIAEITAKLAQRGLSATDIHQIFTHFSVQRIALEEAVALASGLFYPKVVSQGLSLGDRICLALGCALKLPVLTADSMWRNLDLPVEVCLIRY